MLVDGRSFIIGKMACNPTFRRRLLALSQEELSARMQNAGASPALMDQIITSIKNGTIAKVDARVEHDTLQSFVMEVLSD